MTLKDLYLHCGTQILKWKERTQLKRRATWRAILSTSESIIEWAKANLYSFAPVEVIPMNEWDHYKESTEMQYKYSELTKQRIKDFHKAFPEIKHMLFVCQHNHPQRPVNELYEELGHPEWMTIVTTQEFRERYHSEWKSKHPNNNGTGMAIMRMLVSHALRREIWKHTKTIHPKPLSISHKNQFILRMNPVSNIISPVPLSSRK